MGGEAKDEEGKEVVAHEVGMKRASKYIADQAPKSTFEPCKAPKTDLISYI